MDCVHHQVILEADKLDGNTEDLKEARTLLSDWLENYLHHAVSHWKHNSFMDVRNSNAAMKLL